MTYPSRFCLLVEDDPEDQEFFIEALHSVSSNAGCYAVANGEEALCALLQEGFTPHYIFTDLNMPRMDGFGLLRALRNIEQFRAIPVIVYSSEYSEEVVRQVKGLGASAMYSKTRYDVLKDILRRYFSEPATRSLTDLV